MIPFSTICLSVLRLEWPRSFGSPFWLVLALIASGLAPARAGVPEDAGVAIQQFSLDEHGVFHARLHAGQIRPQGKGPRIEAEDISLDIEGQLSFPGPEPLFDGRAVLESRALVLDDSVFHRVKADFRGQLRLGADADLAGVLTVSFSAPSTPGAKKGRVRKIFFDRISGKLRRDDGALRASGRFRLGGLDLPMGFRLFHRFDNGKGRLEIDAGALAAKRIRTEVFPLFPELSGSWPRDLTLVSGKASLKGALRWDQRKGAHPLMISVELSGIGGGHGATLFSGLAGRFKTTVGDRIRSEASDVSLAIVDVGVPITDLGGGVTVDVDKDRAPVITLTGFSAKVLGGAVSAPGIEIDLNREENDFRVGFEGIDVARIVSLHPFEGLRADGRLSGELPIRLGPEGLSVGDGKVSAMAPGGRIRYRPDESGDAIADAAPQMKALMDVLEEFHYHTLEATANYTPDGQLKVDVSLRGRGGIGGNAGRPVHLNLGIEQNIRSLLTELRRVDGLNDRLDDWVRRRFSPGGGGR
uniref:Dicarboxylate transport n=1 Tax=Candidatus Kentrum sp. DK TaxID=2126562 RepID=A0A450TI72_9GAMM|nr:MAG: Dicarboxylate transport [Candidatus Kentron sp. DK]